MASANVRLIQDEEFERGIRADGTSAHVLVVLWRNGSCYVSFVLSTTCASLLVPAGSGVTSHWFPVCPLAASKNKSRALLGRGAYIYTT
jgi:hypothetical protein